MKKVYDILGKGVKWAAYIALVIELIEALRSGLEKINPEVASKRQDIEIESDAR